MSYSTDVASFMEALGPFYEHVDVPSKSEGASPVAGAANLLAQDLQQQVCVQTPLSSGTGDESADSALSLEYEVPEKFNMVGMNGIHAPNGLLQEIVDCSDQVHKLKGSLKNGVLCNGDMPNGVVNRGSYPHPDVTRDTSAAPLGGAADAGTTVRNPRAGRSVASDTESEDEYAVPPEEMSGDECVVMNGVFVEGASSHSPHDQPPSATPLQLAKQVGADPLQCNGRACDSGASGLADTSSASGRSSTCDLGSSGLIRSSTKITTFSPWSNRSMKVHDRNMSASLQAHSSGEMVQEEGGPRGGEGGDVVLVLRQMQGDLQAMTQCLQAHLNDISQCLAALHRTSIALQAHSEGAGGGGGGGGGGAVSPVSEAVQRRQWWPFPELSPRSTFWLLLWPVILHAALHAFKIAVRMRVRRKK